MKFFLFLSLLFWMASVCRAQFYPSGAKWLPQDNKVIDEYMGRLLAETENSTEPLLPVVQEFQDMIENDTILYMLFSSMFTEVPQGAPYNDTIYGDPQVRDYKVALRMMNKIIRKAPEYSNSSLVGLPLSALLSWSMGTKSGFSFFVNEKVNQQLKKVLNDWSRFLLSPESCDVLNESPSGWLSTDAQNEMGGLVDLYECDPSKEYYGFTSWDDFFVREFRPGKRPVPAENASDILNVCESAPYRLVQGVNKSDTFWIKAQPYSLVHMLANDSLTDNFVGGTVYQAFLSPTSYHRWHSPVNGQVVKAYVVNGTYYSKAPSFGLNDTINEDSQSYLAEVAARAIILIESDNSDIGLVGIVLIGMAEVSSCEITVKEGDMVKKGDQLGMFHFGGSTHCLLFGPDVKWDFDFRGQQPGGNTTDIPVRGKLASLV